MDARIDLWLKLVCLFKHRTEATEACKGGHVKINGNRAKPASTVRIDDVIEITEPHYRKVVVTGIPEHSIAKAVARTMYRDETPARPADDLYIPSIGERDRGAGRPTKRERREIQKWKK